MPFPFAFARLNALQTAVRHPHKDQYSHLVSIDEDICRASAYLRHTIQTVIMKPGKNDCIIWDGTTILLALNIVMNQVTPVTCEAPIMFGHIKIQLNTDIYNTCVSHPNDVILLGNADIKACFHFPRIHPDLTGAFGFMAGGILQLNYSYGIWFYYLCV